MTETTDGGPAFPRQTWDYYPSLNKTHAGTSELGMSLRDWFAGQAICGVIACVHPFKIEPEKNEMLAAMAYAIADELLRVRATPPDLPA